MSSDPPADAVALALSGGGYRAAGFHLGVLRLLESVGLLDKVKVVSTVSGGSLVGLCWLLSRARGESFADFERTFRARLLEVDVVQQALARGSPKLITAAAQVFDERFLGGATMEALAGLKGVEVVVNATEFTNGLAFRFRRTELGLRQGNGKLDFPIDVARGLRLADVLAASACFPGAFEPITFPADFVGARAAEVEFQTELMDGGIYDNQGLESVLRIHHLDSAGRPRLGLVVVSDSDRPRPDEVLPPAWRLSWPVAVALAVVLGLAVASLGFAVVDGASASLDAPWRRWGRGLSAVLWAGLGIAGSVGLYRLLPASRLGGLLGFLLRRPGLLFWRLGLRLRSSAMMAASVFMKRVRDLSYRALMTSSLGQRAAIVSLYDLLGNDELGAGLKGAVERAAGFGTTLWFPAAERERLEDLVRSGEATACDQLLRHLRARKDRSADDEALLGRLARRWEVLSGA